ncbi:hypothetical protein SUGI_1027160 [Cryptomeria japonica]|uniref:cytochrome b561, DM13 and DOMON domain-containing protein At5g54830 n=1 Tax=Cryptomeria japonica TaxID=3369 RepID=UPI002414977E|nr:cytochrome b561, DM13 and DOMON domain-containing protein At5g54830 [Cryptomeria japonica]GLJ48702.1 hypothetical protein SUGI_1027160 [Cryptomeria japonica]
MISAMGLGGLAMESTTRMVLSVVGMVILGFMMLGFFSNAESVEKSCTHNSSMVGFSGEFKMVQHQLRGLMTVLDDCSFRVTNFDMIEGSEVIWWGAHGDDFQNLTEGFIVSEEKLNRTYKNDSMVVRLSNYTFDQFSVLGVWDVTTASDFGHVLLEVANDSVGVDDGFTLAPSPAPAPSNENGSEYRIKRGAKQPVMFDSCIELATNFRLRWSLNRARDVIDIGLEAVVSERHYLAFGWARPKSLSRPMLHADVAVTGFTDQGHPFADDYYITKYSECVLNKDGGPSGVCPDYVYADSEGNSEVNNTRLVYGQRQDGVSLIRYQRPLQSADAEFDVSVNATDNMSVIWALGLMRPPDSLRPLYLPQNHGATYGHTTFRVADIVDKCLGPLEAETKDDRAIIVADGKSSLIVGADNAVHYPNPPNPLKVLYINKKEAPSLKVERGVPVTFSVQAGHDVAFYITSDPIGGAASVNKTQNDTIYAGGEDAHGVPANPFELKWTPDRKTPDQVFYQSFYEKKMGWKVQVVDGGLSDMYNSSVFLDDQQVSLFWTLSETSISLAVRGERKSGYIAIGLGAGMVNSFAYVGWVDGTGKGNMGTYWIDGRESSKIHPTEEKISDLRCRSENGIITFEFTRPLNPQCSGKNYCKNIIDPSTPLKVVWAIGALWSEEHLSERNMHSETSTRAVLVHLLRGAAEADEALRPVLAVHGFMMFLAWGILLPGGILAARYLKHVKGDGWFQIHVYLQYSGIAVMLLGVLFAAAELRGFYIRSLHVKFGVAAILFACAQPVNAYLRPKKPTTEEMPSSKRILWEYLHIATGRSAVVIGIVALISGMRQLGDRYGIEHVKGLNWALILWFLVGAMAVVYLEYRESKSRKIFRSASRSNWVMENNEDDDSLDLLHSNRPFPTEQSHRPSQGMEVQLEPMH